MKRNFFILTLFVVLSIFALTAYSNQDASNIIQIRVGEFYFKPETLQFKAGQKVKIELVNEGKIEHEFMVGQGIKIEEGEHEMNETMHNAGEEEHKHNEGMHDVHGGMSKRFEKDFFDGVDVAAQTESGVNFMKVSDHGTMVTLKPRGKATLTFKVPTDRKGEWIMACFMPGHYESNMKGKVIVK